MPSACVSPLLPVAIAPRVPAEDSLGESPSLSIDKAHDDLAEALKKRESEQVSSPRTVVARPHGIQEVDNVLRIQAVHQEGVGRVCESAGAFFQEEVEATLIFTPG
jgi:hypothetical protein